MRDLLVIVPSRGRPAAVAELRSAIRATSNARTDLIVAFDDDDPERGAYQRMRAASRQDRRVMWATGPRAPLARWTNQLAVAHAPRYRAVCSMGDDHRPRTPGWDVLLLAALDETGGTGVAYGDDLLMGAKLPTAAVVSSDIVAALGWMCQPSLRHYCVDNVWHVLGASAGCLHYLPDVVIEHLHPLRTHAVPDRTYREAEARATADHDAFRCWVAGDAVADIAVVRNLLRRECLTTRLSATCTAARCGPSSARR